MTDHEKDREAVERLDRHVSQGATLNPPWNFRGRSDDADRVLALAREALAMRERGIWAWCVEPDDDDEELLPPTVARGGGREAALRHRDEYYPGGRVFPLYAGEPVEEEE